MAVIVNTQKPQALLQIIKKGIDDRKIETWEYDKDGDFTHRPSQWRGLTWLRPSVAPGVLRFGLVPVQNVTMTRELYGVYHGRFIEMLLAHFGNEFTTAVATAQVITGVDIIK